MERDDMAVEFPVGRVLPVVLEEEMRQSYLDYAMNVIVDRALPDVRDGLKPVQRRILYSMYELGLRPDRPHKKAARVVGEVIGKYHPHSDTAIYDAMVRMGQDFSYRYLLVDGHGNYGSIDGDPPAAMRYTECRMSKLALEMLRDIDKDTVDFYPNFDETLEQPTVLPSRFPNLLVNGAMGIAVGMSTNIPPHNLGEVIDALILLIDQPDVGIEDLMKKIKGPDFPTGGVIVGHDGIREAYTTGRGRIQMRGRINIETERSGKQRLVITEIPYMVNKSVLVEKIATLHRDKKVEGISALRDESDRQGMRVVIELRRDANPHVAINQLYKHSPLQETFGVISLALVDNEPKVLEVHVINLAEHASAFMSRIYTAQHIDPTQAGHYATQQFWLEDRPLLPSPAVGALADETLLSVTWPHGVTTSGLAVLNLPEPALVRVLALPTTGAMPCPAEPLSSAAFPLTDLFEEVPYSLPRDPLVLSVGRANYLNNTSHVLRGNYGVIHHYRIIAANPTEQPQCLSIYTRQAGGVSRAFVRVDETLLPMPTSATYEKRLLAQKTVPARSEMVFDLATMPQSGSNMPIDFILESSGPEANTATRSHSVATSKASR
jgi:hypothetical protein